MKNESLLIKIIHFFNLEYVIDIKFFYLIKKIIIIIRKYLFIFFMNIFEIIINLIYTLFIDIYLKFSAFIYLLIFY